MQALKTAYQEYGIKGLFRGLSSTIARDVPFTFIFFGAYEAWTSFITDFRSSWLCSPSFITNPDSFSGKKLNSVGIYLAGGLSGASAWSFIFPIDVVKSRIQIYNSSVTFVYMTKHIYSQYGMHGFYRGWSSAIIRAFPANAGLFLGYETAIKFLKEGVVA